MAKFTTKFVRDNIEAVVGDQLDFDALKVVSKQKAKGKGGKMVEVMDREATAQVVEGNLLYYRGYLDAMMVFESKFPEGIADIVNSKMADWETLRAAYEKQFPDEHAAWAEQYNIEPYEDVEASGDDDEEEDESEEDEGVDYGDMSLSELRAECKARGISYTPKDKSDVLISKLEEDDAAGEEDEDEAEEEDEESTDYADLSLGELRKLAKERGIKYSPKTKADELVAALEEYDSENEESDDEEEDESEEDEGVDYGDMSLSELRAECKERGIKYTPKHKSADLIAMLEEDDSSSDEGEEDESEDEESEDGDEEVSEEDLNQILDEEFEDETLEEEEAKAPAKGNKGKKLPPKKGKK